MSRQVDKCPDEKRALWVALVVKNHPLENIIGDLKEDITTRAFYKQQPTTFISHIVLSNVNEALEDDSWVKAMQEELD